MKAPFDAIRRLLDSAHSIMVCSHLRPDVDALGSTIAMALHLRATGKAVETWNEDGLPEKFTYLPDHHLITRPPASPKPFDVVVCLDCSSRKRIGTPAGAVAPGAKWINIDHHQSNERFGDLSLVDESAPATGQILFEYFESIGAPITADMASCLYAAISTDTGSFQYAGTGVRTFAAAASLVEAGVDVPALSVEMYGRFPRRRFELLRHALNSAQFVCGDRIATFSLDLTSARQLGIRPEDTEGVIDHLRAVEGVLAAVMFEELEDGRIRVSARSKDPRVSVCRVCAQFGGGGHPLASGARVTGSLSEVSREFTQALCHEINTTT